MQENNIIQEINNIILETNDLINVKKYLEQNKEANLFLQELVKKNNIDVKNSYIRKLLYQNDNFEIIGIYWNKNAVTKIHDHAEKGCVMCLVTGSLTEFLYNNELQLIKKTDVTNINYINNNIGYHCIISNDYSSSYHIYAPPNYISTKF